MEIFYLKQMDTKPNLLVTLKNPDGTVHDLTGLTDFKLHIKLQGGTVLAARTMSVFGAPTNGQIIYAWVTGDWNAGNLVAGVHEMEYESVAERLTFPNDSNHRLIVTDDIGQG